jgi:hypothetical protein
MATKDTAPAAEDKAAEVDAPTDGTVIPDEPSATDPILIPSSSLVGNVDGVLNSVNVPATPADVEVVYVDTQVEQKAAAAKDAEEQAKADEKAAAPQVKADEKAAKDKQAKVDDVREGVEDAAAKTAKDTDSS